MNRMIIFQEYIFSESKEIGLSAYYPANYSVLEMDTSRINPKNVRSAMVVNDYYTADKKEVCESAMKDTIEGLKSDVNNLSSQELMIYSNSLAKTKIETMYNGYQYTILDTSEEVPQLKYINEIIIKELKGRMKHY